MEQTTALKIVKDPVCGKEVLAGGARSWDYLFENVVYFFCGAECRSNFNANPRGFLGGGPSAVAPATPEPKNAETDASFLQTFIAKLRARFS